MKLRRRRLGDKGTTTTRLNTRAKGNCWVQRGTGMHKWTNTEFFNRRPNKHCRQVSKTRVYVPAEEKVKERNGRTVLETFMVGRKNRGHVTERRRKDE